MYAIALGTSTPLQSFSMAETANAVYTVRMSASACPGIEVKLKTQRNISAKQERRGALILTFQPSFEMLEED